MDTLLIIDKDYFNLYNWSSKIKWISEKEWNMAGKGRPTVDDKRDNQYRVRLNDEENQDKRHINLNNLMDLFDEMAYEGHWRETLEFIAHAYKENSSVRSAMEGERNIQGFFTAYLSVNAYYLMAPEMELSHGYCDLFLMPDLMRYEVKHSYILELKYLSVKDTEEKARTQWQEAVKQINEYAAAPRVRQLVQNTKLHCIIIQFRGWELERMEEV